MTDVPSHDAGQDKDAPLWFVFGKGGLLARRAEGPGQGWAFPREADLLAIGAATGEAEEAGRLRGERVMAISLPDASSPPAGWSWLNLRRLVEEVDLETFTVAGRGAHLVDFRTTSRFCGRCGAQALRAKTEKSMQCPACNLRLYPRISPAAIVLVRKGDLALLARNARFPLPFYSTVAGFADIGETLEETVQREILEEVGVVVGAPRYFGSQPWPFPNSLMVGFTAEWVSGDIKVDGEEIADARWFTREELPMIPPRISIARQMIDAWVREGSSPVPAGPGADGG